MRQCLTSVLLTGLLLVGCTPKSSGGDGSGGNNSGSGGGNGNGSGGNNGSGGGNGSGSGGSHASSGGSNGSGSGGSNGSGSGGSSSSGSGGATGTPCTADASNLVDTGGWVCDADIAPMIQGAFYAYGDMMSCANPLPANPCGDNGCCISGTLTNYDSTKNNWGCGLGMELNSSGGTTPVKMAYGGPAKCFNFTLSGNSGGAPVRVGFKQSTSDSDIAPFVELGAFTDGITQKICFADAMCPSWAATMGCTKAVGDDGTPFDIQVQVSAGAATAGDYNVCITKIEPIIDGGSTGSGGSTGGTATCTSPSNSMGTITDPFGTTKVGCGSQQYVIQNNDWGARTGETISYGPGTKMKVATQTGTGSNNNPASFPSVFIGQNSNNSSGDNPKAVSAITKGSLPTSWTWTENGATGSYNAAYDVWFSTSSSGEPAASSPTGGFLMVWYHKPTDNQPIGTMMNTVNIAGQNWNVWEGNNSGNGKPCITYQAATTIHTLSFNLGDFIRDAVDNQKFLMNSWYLTNVFAGYEIWTGGAGLETTDFTATMK
ncbi:MAG TPA: hypothetical protein VGP07_15220 [Polyangia bacterium]|jgi:hypothetical protein